MRDDDQPNVDLPGKPFRTPGKSKTHPAPGGAADGHKPQSGRDDRKKK